MIRPSKVTTQVVQPWLVAALAVMGGAYAVGMSGGSGSSGEKLVPPTGVIGGTMKTLDEIEPRTPVSERFVSSKPGVTFAITEPGSYYLPDDIVAGANEIAISIEAAPVTLDLMGHTVDGAGGSLDLIYVAELADRVWIKNGTLRRSGMRGLYSVGDTLVVEDLEIVETLGSGIHIDTGRSAKLRDVTIADAGTGSTGDRSGVYLAGPGVVSAEHMEVTHTGGDGFNVSSSTRLTLTDSLVTDAALDGIAVGSKSVVQRVRVDRSGGYGILAGDNCVVEECHIDSFGLEGVRAGERSRIQSNRIYAYEGEVQTLGAAVKIVGSDAIVKMNTVVGGGELYFGIRLEGQRNLLSCNRNYDNLGYSMTSGNMIGPILNSVGAYNSNNNPDANYDQ